MPTKYLPNGKGDTTYSFGGGGNTVTALDSDTTNYTVYLGGGDDFAHLGSGNDIVDGGAGSDTIEGGLGNDVLYGGETLANATSKTATYVNQLYGDMQGVSALEGATVTTGNDTLVGGTGVSHNDLFGDGRTYFFLNATGTLISGNDVLYAGDGAATTNTLYGDFQLAQSGVTAASGNDTLVSGTGNDTMWGDTPNTPVTSGGADVFVFSGNNGNDTIMDFGVGHDLIDLTAYGVTNLASAGAVLLNSPGTTLNLSLYGGGTITLQGYTGPMDTSIFKLT